MSVRHDLFDHGRVLTRRGSNNLPVPPVRIVHLGLGAFHRAHQAWYTDTVDADGEWGIAAFTGRRPDAAAVLSAQDGLYTLVVRGPVRDEFSVIRSIVEAHDGADLDRLAARIAAPTTCVVTLTVTEAAYRIDGDGRFRIEDPGVEQDIAALRAGAPSSLATVPARLVHGLRARRNQGSGPLAVVSCDNLTDNGAATRGGVLAVARQVDDALADWIEHEVSFVSTSIDRITPRTTPDDVALVERECGYRDESPVVTEPFTDWVLCGDFPAGRPPWERAGAVFVDDVGPWETRKLWLLNGAHSLLAYLGTLRGHGTVAEAIADPHCRAQVESWWELAAGHLTEPELDLRAYRAELLERWSNRRIEHRLAQIALDGSAKLRNRIPELVNAERARGGSGDAGLAVVAAWIDYVVALPSVTPELDVSADDLESARRLDGVAQTRAFVGLLAPAWADDPDLVDHVGRLRGHELSDPPGNET